MLILTSLPQQQYDPFCCEYAQRLNLIHSISSGRTSSRKGHIAAAAKEVKQTNQSTPPTTTTPSTTATTTNTTTTTTIFSKLVLLTG